MAGPPAVVLSRHQKREIAAPSVLRASPTPERGNAKDQQTTEGQASGGARDWNGARRGAIKTTAAELKCSTDRATNGTGSCGAGGRNEIAVRWIAAQIAQ
jgi:hypothetical protein